jgi:hypothetical protein
MTTDSQANEEARIWPCCVELRRVSIQGGQMTWSISVPADGADHSAELLYAVEQAIKAWTHLAESAKTLKGGEQNSGGQHAEPTA